MWEWVVPDGTKVAYFRFLLTRSPLWVGLTAGGGVPVGPSSDALFCKGTS